MGERIVNMKSFASKAAGIKLSAEEVATAGNRPAAAPRTAPGQLMHLQATAEQQHREIEELKVELSEARRSGSAVEIALTELHEVEGRRRYMAPDKYSELRDNLRHNELINPVVVLQRPEGGYEIQSGHHRTDAYRELGRNSIWCVLGKATADTANAGAFYANLMQSDLTDYEKYVGFKQILDRAPQLSQSQVAEQAGVSASVLSKLMAFAQLPEAVLQTLRDRPTLLGASSGYALASLVREGKAEQVVAAVERLAKGEIDQSQTVKLASAVATKKKAPKTESVKIRIGRSVYCDMRAAKNVIRMEFQSEVEAQAVMDEMRSVLERRAETVKTTNEK